MWTERLDRREKYTFEIYAKMKNCNYLRFCTSPQAYSDDVFVHSVTFPLRLENIYNVPNNIHNNNNIMI